MDSDLGTLSGDECVLHFGGRPSEVNAFTLANSLLAFSEAIREINRQINPNFSIEISVDALGGGSFRARIKTKATGIAGFLAHSSKDLIIAILGAMIYEKCLAPETKIVVEGDVYVVERGKDRIVLPREVYEAKQSLRDVQEVDKHISRGFEVLEEDSSISEFGLARNMNDKNLTVAVNRADFPRLASPILRQTNDDRRKTYTERTTVTVLKAILERSDRKWQFVWRGIKISAPIRQDSFFDKLAAREYEFGQGDSLDVLLAIHQVRDDISGAYLNEGYEVLEVYGHTPGPKQLPLPGTLSH